jgi:hypothetical protein
MTESIASAQPNMPVDIARRILVRTAPLAPNTPAGIVQGLKAIAGEVNTMAQGIDFDANDVRDLLLSQQVMASADVMSLVELLPAEKQANVAMAAHQIMAGAVAAAGKPAEGSLVRQAIDALPERMRAAINVDGERNVQRPA